MRNFFVKPLSLSKTKGFISLCVIIVCLSIKAYGQLSRITVFNYTACSELFYAKDTIWRSEILPGNVLSLKFTYEMPCSIYLYPEILVVTADSVVMKIQPGNKKWDKDSKVSSKKINVSEDYRGYYTFHIELSGVSKVPKEISINNKYHHSYFGFIDSDFYNSVKNKNFHNDSKKISYEQILTLIGKSIKDSGYKDFSGLLGNDYVEYDERHNFVEDHINVTYNSKSMISEIGVDASYFGSLPGNISLNDPISKVVEVLGNPDRKFPNNAILLKDNGEKVIFNQGNIYYYKKYKLSLGVNVNGNITFCVFK